jgi:hypothetical protein
MIEPLIQCLTFSLFTFAGTALLTDCLRWRLGARRMEGTLIGTSPATRSGMHAIYEYTDAVGQRVQGATEPRSHRTTDSSTGRRVSLMAFAAHPEQLQEVHAYRAEAFGLAVLAIGLGMLSALPLSWPRLPIMAVASGGGALLGAAAGLAGQPRPSRATRRGHQRQEVCSLKQFLVGMSVLGLGIIFSLFGARAIRDGLRLELMGVRTSGSVVRVQTGESKGHAVYYPVIGFRTGSGTSIEFQDSSGSTDPRARPIDTTVRVLYLKSDPQHASIDRWTEVVLGPLLLEAVGLAMGVLGVMIMKRPMVGIPDLPIRVPRMPYRISAPDLGPIPDPPVPRRLHPYTGLVVVLFVIDCVVAFAPPAHKTAVAGIGVMLWLLGCFLVMLFAFVTLLRFLTKSVLLSASTLASTRLSSQEAEARQAGAAVLRGSAMPRGAVEWLTRMQDRLGHLTGIIAAISIVLMAVGLFQQLRP